jgi:hypothetical protein
MTEKKSPAKGKKQRAGEDAGVTERQRRPRLCASSFFVCLLDRAMHQQKRAGKSACATLLGSGLWLAFVC